MKNIYTLTFHNADNYGALIQAIALQVTLQKKYNTKLVDYRNVNINYSYKILNTKNKKELIKNILFLFRVLKRKKNFSKFRNKISITERFNTINDLEKDNWASVIVVGSDQVWNPKITGGYDDFYFLNAELGGVKKIAYAVSCGDVSNINGISNKEIDLIRSFDYISTRENTLKDYLEKRNIQSKVVLDPSLLLERNEWNNIISHDRLINEKYIFVYSVGNGTDEYYDYINKIYSETGFLIVYFDRNDFKRKIKGRKKNYYSAGPDEFLNLLINAEYVITTSFHGMAMSIALNKEFAVILSSSPDRIKTLLTSLSLNDRIVSEDNIVDFSTKINWKIVNNNLKSLRKKSKEWLFSNIEKE